MYTVEEIKNKVKTGTWTKGDGGTLCGGVKQISILLFIQKKFYYISYGIFAYNFREYAYPLIEICREAGVHMERSKEKSRTLSCPGKTLFLPWFSPEDCGIWPEICQFRIYLKIPSEIRL